MAWIEVHDTLREHRKTYALASTLKIEQYAAVGLVVSLWTWALNNAQDGDLSAFPLTAIANACLWRKSDKTLIAALQECGFITRDMQIHDWDVYAGKLIEQREIQREQSRVRQQRRRQKIDELKKSASRVSNAKVTQEETQEVTRDKPVTLPVNNEVTVPNPTVPNSTNDSCRGCNNTREGNGDDDGLPFGLTGDEITNSMISMKKVEDAALSVGLPFELKDVQRTEQLIGDYGFEWVVQAIDRTSLREKRSWGTVMGILRSWKKKGGIDEEFIEKPQAQDDDEEGGIPLSEWVRGGLRGAATRGDR